MAPPLAGVEHERDEVAVELVGEVVDVAELLDQRLPVEAFAEGEYRLELVARVGQVLGRKLERVDPISTSSPVSARAVMRSRLIPVREIERWLDDNAEWTLGAP